ncbi:chromate resistance protein [Roseateles sp. DAIF2]|uniref:chromate resistance protein ChrB domain-containing protein n=1 Tax=Roseateles sp. DAIF2 TaxID=2714952 RepID=UPI0018A2FC2C|nr:chromate resistance protein ChrB domain-containing protein [Roseateles sp. DAIF2]QPF74582.1 chromate resistance protein [Roseateles sp. DAIF2]
MNWHLLILSLPTQNSTARMRCWRALKACGAAVLRDGVYLLPQGEARHDALAAIADEARQNEGSAFLLPTQGPEQAFAPLFDRTEEFAALLAQIAELRGALNGGNAMDGLKQGRKLRRSFEQLAATDFFAGEAQRQAEAALLALELAAQRALSPDEPMAAANGEIARLRVEDFRGRLWATRRRPWVDRLASAWLIRRCIDPEARFLWLKSPADCPKKALGFDFDGATFSHQGARVTFETLLASFGLETPPLLRLGLLVHSLDAGGVQPPEAVGVERVLAGMREAIEDDDLLLHTAAGVFEGLLIAFTKEGGP